MIPSMTDGGKPYQNAINERVNGILKQEFDLNRNFKSFGNAMTEVQNAVWKYNNIRPHWALKL